MKILVFILAYNEEESIVGIIERVRCVLPDVMIAVVNDGSRDDTAQRAKQTGVAVINLPYNLGIGGAMQTGLKLGIMGGYDIIVRMDGDGQHPPEEIPKLLSHMVNKDVDIVVGTRFLSNTTSAQVSFPRRMGIFIFSILATWFSGRKITDATCSFQALNRRAAIFLDKNMEQDHPEVDGWILLGRAGYRVKEISVNIPARQKGTSSINMIRAFYFLIKVSLTALAARSRRYIE